MDSPHPLRRNNTETRWPVHFNIQRVITTLTARETQMWGPTGFWGCLTTMCICSLPPNTCPQKLSFRATIDEPPYAIEKVRKLKQQFAAFKWN